MYQLRHKRLGLYQGGFLGLCLWYPASKMPSVGIASLTLQEAKELLESLCQFLRRQDLEIEPFNEAHHIKLMESSR